MQYSLVVSSRSVFSKQITILFLAVGRLESNESGSMLCLPISKCRLQPEGAILVRVSWCLLVVATLKRDKEGEARNVGWPRLV